VRWGSSCGPRTLFVSDLDFTLLRSDATLSARTTDVVNQLVAAGHRFTVATARSFTSTARVTAGLRLSLPLITYGGAVLADPHDGTALAVRAFHPDSIAAIVSLTAAHASLEPLLFALLDGHDRVCWRAPHANGYIQSFAADRPDDPRLLPLPDWSALDDAAVFYVTLIGAEQEVLELHRQLAPWLPDCFITVGPDGYRPTQWWSKSPPGRRPKRPLPVACSGSWVPTRSSPLVTTSTTFRCSRSPTMAAPSPTPCRSWSPSPAKSSPATTTTASPGGSIATFWPSRLCRRANGQR